MRISTKKCRYQKAKKNYGDSKWSFSRDSYYSKFPTHRCRPLKVGGLINKGFKLLSQSNSWLPAPSLSYSPHSKKKGLNLTTSFNTSDSYRTHGTFPVMASKLWWLKRVKARSFRKYSCRQKGNKLPKNKKRRPFGLEAKWEMTKV